jgi:hypothetical protein
LPKLLEIHSQSQAVNTSTFAPQRPFNGALAGQKLPSFAATAHANYERKYSLPSPGALASSPDAPWSVDPPRETPRQPSAEVLPQNPYIQEEDLSSFLPLSSAGLNQILGRMPSLPITLLPGRVIRSFKVDIERLGFLSKELHPVRIIIILPAPILTGSI